MAASLVFECLYAMSMLVNGSSYALCIPPLIVEVCSGVKLVQRSKRKKTPNPQGLDIDGGEESGGAGFSWRLTVNQGVRVTCYVWMFVWVVVVEIMYSKLNGTLLIAFIPIAVFSVVSLGADFFLVAPERVLNVYSGIYKACRLLFYIQLLSLAGSLSQTADHDIEVTDLSSHLWPIQVGALLLSPVLISGLLYYTYYFVTRIRSKQAAFDKRHMITYPWFMVSSISLLAVVFFNLRMRDSLFDQSKTTLIFLFVSAFLITINLAYTIVARRQLM